MNHLVVNRRLIAFRREAAFFFMCIRLIDLGSIANAGQVEL